MEDKNSYQQIIYRTNDERDNSYLVNSFRFRSSSGNKYKKWSPDISNDERFKKKRQREDNYIKNLDQSDKPILLIQKKHVFKNLKMPKTSEANFPQNEDYFKISKNTEVINDIDQAIKSSTPAIRKQTYIHDGNPQESDPFSLKAIYKIQGIEFLPKGFLELEPLLYKDEYAFENQFHENLFESEQRKMKSLRRKQYTQKEQQKKREVTLFICEQYKDNLTEYLEEWYANHKRRLTQNEIEYVAKVLNTDPKSFSDLQEMYLKKKRVENAKRLKDFLSAEKNIRDDRILSLPFNIQQYFVKNENPQNKVDVRRAKSQAPRHKNWHNSYLALKFGEIVLPSNMNQIQNQDSSKNDRLYGKNLSTNSEKDKTHSENFQRESGKILKNDKLGKTSIAQNMNESNLNNIDKQQNQQGILNFNNKNQQQKLTGLTQKSSSILPISSTNKDLENKPLINEATEIEQYFDKEINMILHRIRTTSYTSSNNPLSEKITVGNIKQVNFSNPKSPENKLSNSESQNSSIAKPNSQQQKNDQTNFSPSNYKNFSRNEIHPFPKAPNLVEELPKKNSKFSPQINFEPLSAIESDLREIRMSSQLKKYQADPFLYKERSPAKLTDNNLPRMSSQLELYNKDPFGYKIPGLAFLELESDKLEQFVEVDSRGEPKNSSPFRSRKLNSETENAIKSSSLGFSENKGNIRAPQNSNFKIQKENSTEKQFSFANKVSSSYNFLPNPKRITIISKNSQGDSIVSQKLRPSLIGNQYYYQTIEDLIEANGKRKIVAIVKDESGDIIAKHPVKWSNLGSFHHSTVVFDHSTKIGKTEVSLLFRNEKAENLAVVQIPFFQGGNSIQENFANGIFEPKGDRRSTVISTKIGDEETIIHNLRPFAIGSEFYRQSLTHVKSSKAQKLTVTTFNENGQAVSVKNISLDFAGQSYLSYIEKEIIDQNNIRKSLVNTVNNFGQVILQQIIETNLEELLNEYKAMALIEEFEDENGNRTLTILESIPKQKTLSVNTQLRPSLFGEEYYFEVIQGAFDANGKQDVTLVAKNNPENIIFARKTTIDNFSLFACEYLFDMQKEVEEKLGKEFIVSGVNLLRSLSENYSIQIFENKLQDKNRTQSLKILALDCNGQSFSQKSFEVANEKILSDPRFYKLLTEIETDFAGQKKSSIAKISGSGNRFSQNSKVSNAFSHSDTKSQKKSIVHETKDLQNNQIKNFPGDASGRISNTKITQNFVEDQVDSKNIYYRRLIDDLIKNNHKNKSLSDFKSLEPQVIPAKLKKSQTMTGIYKEDPKVQKEFPKISLNSLYDQNKFGVNVQMEISNPENKLFQNSGQELATNNKIKYSVTSTLLKRGSDLQNKFENSEQSKKSPTKNNDLILNNSQKLSFGDPLSLYSNSKQLISKESQSQINELTPKESILPNYKINSSVDNNIDPIFKNVNRPNDPTHQKSLISESNNKKETNYIPKNSLNNKNSKSQLDVPENTLKNSDINFSKLNDHVYSTIKNQSSERNSLTPTKFSGIKTNNLVDKSKALKSYLDDYINILYASQNRKRDQNLEFKEISEKSLSHLSKNKAENLESNNLDNVLKEKFTLQSNRNFKFDPEEEKILKEKIFEIFKQEQNNLSQKVLDNVKLKINEEFLNGENLLDEFYRFCENELPHDQNYKESMILVSLFYYFLEKKNLIK